jgi:hypothetical protein
MKKALLILSLFISTLSFAQTKINSKEFGTLEFIELDHGLAKDEKGTTEKLENTPTKTHGWLKDFAIIEVTDSIHMVHKANFGVVYWVKANDSVDINVDIEWIYPKKVRNEKGEVFKSIRYTTKRPTNTPSASSYSLDASYEMVPGTWIVNFYLENKLVYTRTFFLYE